MQRRRIVRKHGSFSPKKEFIQGELEHLKDFNITTDEIIQKEKLIEYASKNDLKFYSYQDIIHKNPTFTSKKYLFHMGDEPFNTKKLLSINKDFEHLYSVNCEAANDVRVFPIPLGVTDTSWCPLIGDLDIIIGFNRKPKDYINLAYINFNTDRRDMGLECRLKIKELFSDKDWVTEGKFQRDIEGHREFIRNIYNHKFVFCPRGNGVDTHRLWMALYLKSVPIVFIDNWEEVNQEMLDKKWDEIHKNKYDFSVLKMSFWDKMFSS